MRQPYQNDLTDLEWQIVSPLIPAAKRGGRPRLVDIRSILDAIFYVANNGIKWRDLPHDSPIWQTVYWYFINWSRDGTLEKIHSKLRRINRVIAGKTPCENAGIIDSQSTKTTEEAKQKGFDAGKKIKGRKRHLFVDTLGLVIEVLVHSAGIQDRDGGRYLINKSVANKATVRKIYVDGSYRGKLINWAEEKHNIVLGVIKRTDSKKFVVLAKRWIVERVFAWISRYRRLAKDYERLAQTVRSWIHIIMSRIMLRWIARKYAYG